jgi:16S rRNA (adenine1518-N6/adenine1519-N6)-dimethyltransferase
MLQREFAERLSAQPNTKQYGRLTVMAAYHSMVELLEIVAPDAFYPPPAVSSALVRVIRKDQATFAVKDLDLFRQVVTALFNQRRKKIRTPLKAFLGKGEFGRLQDKIAWQDQRVEDLSPEQLAEISNIIYEERQI